MKREVSTITNSNISHALGPIIARVSLLRFIFINTINCIFIKLNILLIDLNKATNHLYQFIIHCFKGCIMRNYKTMPLHQSLISHIQRSIYQSISIIPKHKKSFPEYARPVLACVRENLALLRRSLSCYKTTPSCEGTSFECLGLSLSCLGISLPLLRQGFSNDKVCPTCVRFSLAYLGVENIYKGLTLLYDNLNTLNLSLK